MDENRAIGRLVICIDIEDSEKIDITSDKYYLLWNLPMFPISKLEERTLSPSTILTLLASDNKNRFTQPVTQLYLKIQKSRLKVDGGANQLVTKNMDYLHTS